LALLVQGCAILAKTTYSIDEQYRLADARSGEMANHLDFSVQFDENIHVGSDIFFSARLTNISDSVITVRIPNQAGVIEIIAPATIFFEVEPLDKSIDFSYPLEGLNPYIVLPKVERDEFITLQPSASHQVRLQLPHIVGANNKDAFALPPGDYLIHMSYINKYIGYETEKDGGTEYVDIGAWVGEVEATPVRITINP
jgi:hypothetical protein